MMTTKTEKRILKNIHLTGTMGKCGSMTKQQRVNTLTMLIKKGLLHKSGCKLTAAGINQI